MEVTSLEHGSQAVALANMRRSHLANMHRRVEADVQAAYDRSASVQVCRQYGVVIGHAFSGVYTAIPYAGKEESEEDSGAAALEGAAAAGAASGQIVCSFNSCRGRVHDCAQ